MIPPIAERLSAAPLGDPEKALGFTRLTSRLFVIPFLLFGTLLLAACALTPAVSLAPRPQAADAFNGAIGDLSDYQLPTPEPTVEAELTVIVSTGGSRANIRSGPGTDFPIIGKANPDEAFEVLARSEDSTWWQICCIRMDASGAAITTTQEGDGTGWLADSVVRAAGEGEDISILQPLFGQDMTAEWDVDWQCGSDRCEVKECTATVEASVARSASNQLVPIEHQVVWEDACFETDSWLFDINQYTGQERSGQAQDNFLYSYWLGSNPGDANGVYTLEDGKAAAVYCSGPHEVEIEEGGGWTTVYEGNTCHDVRTGLLVYLAYNKRWLFTGEFEGEMYERVYFGDFEQLEQKLKETNVELFFVERAR